MTHEERVKRVAGFGFTERQAAFLVEVMLHSGFFLGRQYCTFARIVRGQKMVDFFEKLTSRRLATPYLCGHNKARVYHVHNATLYDAIEQRDVRFRKRMALGRALERLMMLDHVIAHREFRWLGAEQDKVAHFLTTTSLDRDALPRLAFGVEPNITVRYFPDKLPIGVSPDGRHSRVPVPPGRARCRTTSECSCAAMRNSCARCRHGPSSSSSRSSRPTAKAERRTLRTHYETAFRQELGTPLRPGHGERAAVVLAGAARSAPAARRHAYATGASHLRDAAVSSPAPSLELDGERAVDVAMSTESRRRHRT